MEQRVQVKRRVKRKKVCYFCVNKVNALDYKKIDLLDRYTTERGKIYPKRNSGICAKHQRMLAQAVKRARFMGLIAHCED